MGVLIFEAAASNADSITRLAVSDTLKKDPFEDLGASAFEGWRALRRSTGWNRKALLDTVAVRAVDLSRVVHSAHRRLSRGTNGASESRMLMKMDIEGLELAVLPAMIRAQALCTLDAIRIEWHMRLWTNTRSAATSARALNLSLVNEVGGMARQALAEAIRSTVRAQFAAGGPASGRMTTPEDKGMRSHTTPDCNTVLLEADDESYMHDRKNWNISNTCL